MIKTMQPALRVQIRSATKRPPTMGDHMAFAVWIAAYVAVLAIAFAPKGTFDATPVRANVATTAVVTEVAP